MCRLSSASQPLCGTLRRTTRRGAPVPPSGASVQPYGRLKAEVAAIPAEVWRDGRAGQRHNTRAAGSPQGPRADTYTSIYIYIDFAKPKAAPSGAITSAKLQSRVRPKSTGISAIQKGHRFSCGEPSGLKVPINLTTCRLNRQRGRGPPNETLARRSRAYDGWPMFAADQVRDSGAAIWSSRSNRANRDFRVARGCSPAGYKRGPNNYNYNYKKVRPTRLTAAERQPPATRSNGWLREYPTQFPLAIEVSPARMRRDRRLFASS